VPAGANTPTQIATANPGATDVNGGRSGNAGCAVLDVTASALILPLFISGAIVL
jgi:hypothetical protein